MFLNVSDCFLVFHTAAECCVVFAECFLVFLCVADCCSVAECFGVLRGVS